MSYRYNFLVFLVLLRLSLFAFEMLFYEILHYCHECYDFILLTYELNTILGRNFHFGDKKIIFSSIKKVKESQLNNSGTCKCTCRIITSGPGCSKLMTSLINVSLKFQMLISQACQYFMLKKIVINKKFQCIWL